MTCLAYYFVTEFSCFLLCQPNAPFVNKELTALCFFVFGFVNKVCNVPFSASSPIVVLFSLFFCSQFLRSLHAFWFLKLIRKSTLTSTQYTNMDLDWISFHSCISFPFLPADKLRHLFGVLVFIAHFMVRFTLKHKRYRGIGSGWNFLHTNYRSFVKP